MAHMTQPTDVIRNAAQAALDEHGGGVRRLEAMLGLKRWSLRGILDSNRPQSPSVDRAAELCRALSLEFYVGPRRAPANSASQPLESQSSPALAPVSDVRLARMLALLADEWEASDERARSQLERRFHLHFAELEGGGPVRRLVGWLGWRVIEGAREG